MHKVKIKVGQKFLAIMKHGFNEGKVAHGSPFKCTKTGRIGIAYQIVHAVDAEGLKRRFSGYEFEFKEL